MKVLPNCFTFLLLLVCSSCGLLGIQTGNDPVITDPVLRDRMLASYETPLAAYQDSLIARIDAATQTIPADLAQTTLVIETYDYKTYINTFNIKYHRPDSAKLKKQFLRYSEGIAKHKFLKKPKYRTRYADTGTLATLDLSQYRYVLKATTRTNIDVENVAVYESGFVAPLVATVVYYLYDRQTNAVFREIKDFNALEN